MATKSGLPEYDRDNGQPGIMCPSGGGAYAHQAAVALTAGRAYLARFVPSRPMTISLIGFYVTTAAGADDACDVGIYDSSWYRIVSAGATTGKLNSTGMKTVAVTATLLQPRTVYYGAFSVVTPFGGTTASLAMTAQAILHPFGSTAGFEELAFLAASHPLPNSLTGAGGNIANVPLLAMRES